MNSSRTLTARNFRPNWNQSTPKTRNADHARWKTQFRATVETAYTNCSLVSNFLEKVNADSDQDRTRSPRDWDALVLICRSAQNSLAPLITDGSAGETQTSTSPTIDASVEPLERFVEDLPFDISASRERGEFALQANYFSDLLSQFLNSTATRNPDPSGGLRKVVVGSSVDNASSSKKEGHDMV